MSNCCYNYIAISADGEDEVNLVLSEILNEEGSLDFSRVVPMPDFVRKNRAEHRDINKKMAQIWIDEFRGDSTICEKSADLEQVDIRRIDFLSWYDWSIENWGVKWNASRTEVYDEDIAFGFAEIGYETAWTPPVRYLAKLRDKYPDVGFEFRCRFSDDHEYPHEVSTDKILPSGFLEPSIDEMLGKSKTTTVSPS